MIDLLIMYCSFMYLFTGGVIGYNLTSNRYFYSHQKLGMLVHFVTAPISTPIILGMICGKNNA